MPDEPTLLNLDPWWDEPAYKAALGTFTERGMFILRKLREHDAARLDDVLSDLYRDTVLAPMNTSRFEWQTILAFMGASDEEINDVQMRMGRLRRGPEAPERAQ